MNYENKVHDISLSVLELVSEMELDEVQVKEVVLRHTDYVLEDYEFDGVLKGHVHFLLAKLVLMALTEEVNDRQAKKLEKNHPDIISVGEMSDNLEEQTMLYTVRAKTAEDAIQKLADYGVNVQGHRNETDYDCSGQWCASPLTARNAVEIPNSGVWVLKHSWSLDV